MHDVLKAKVIGVEVSRLNPRLAFEQIRQCIKERFKAYVCVAPVSTLVSARRDARYAAVVRNAFMTTPDGMPVAWALRAQGFKEVERTYGPDLMRDLCIKGQELGWRHYFYGGEEKTLGLLEKQLKQIAPSIKIVGMFAPAFNAQARLEDQAVLAQIEAAKPDILWVGIGSPKQDFWMSMHREKLSVPVMVGIGAAFDFIAGVKKQAPRWMGRCGLEWLFRLMSEPGRLGKRYLVGNTLFIYYLIIELFNHRRSR